MVEDWNKQMPQVVKDAKNQLVKNVSEKQERSHALHLVTLRTWCRPKSQGQGWQTSANQGIYIYICSSQWCSSQCTHSVWLLSKLQNLLQHWDLLQVPQTWMGIFWRRWREPQFEILMNFKVRKRWHFLFSCLTCILLHCQLPFPYLSLSHAGGIVNPNNISPAAILFTCLHLLILLYLSLKPSILLWSLSSLSMIPWSLP